MELKRLSAMHHRCDFAADYSVLEKLHIRKRNVTATCQDDNPGLEIVSSISGESNASTANHPLPILR